MPVRVSPHAARHLAAGLTIHRQRRARARADRPLRARLRTLRAALEAGDHARAQALCLRALAERPDAETLYRTLGQVLEAEGAAAEATECFTGRLPARFAGLLAPDLSYSDGATDDVALIAIHPPERTAPRSRTAADEPPLAHWARRDLVSAPSAVCTVDEGALWLDEHNSVVYDRLGRVIRPALHGNAAPASAARARTPARRLRGDVVVLGARGSNNYFHWMTDILPKLALVERAGVDWRRATVVVQCLSHRFQLDTLRSLGVHPRRVHATVIAGRHVRADRLIVPALDNAMCLKMGRWVSEFLRERFGPERPPHPSRKLFVSRAPARSRGRGISNIAEINAFFAARGYEIVYPELLDVHGQAALFASATHVAAPHGAGLTNLHFCAPGTRVLEFYGDHLAPCYWALSEINGLDYRVGRGAGRTSFDGDRLGAAKSLPERRMRGFAMPLDRLRTLLGESGSDRP